MPHKPAFTANRTNHLNILKTRGQVINPYQAKELQNFVQLAGDEAAKRRRATWQRVGVLAVPQDSFARAKEIFPDYAPAIAFKAAGDVRIAQLVGTTGFVAACCGQPGDTRLVGVSVGRRDHLVTMGLVRQDAFVALQDVSLHEMTTLDELANGQRHTPLPIMQAKY